MSHLGCSAILILSPSKEEFQTVVLAGSSFDGLRMRMPSFMCHCERSEAIRIHAAPRLDCVAALAMAATGLFTAPYSAIASGLMPLMVWCG